MVEINWYNKILCMIPDFFNNNLIKCCKCWTMMDINFDLQIPCSWYKHLMMTIMIMMRFFCGMVDRRKTFSLISSHDDCQRSSPSWISDTSRAEHEPLQHLSSGFIESSCGRVITTTHLVCGIRMLKSEQIWKESFKMNHTYDIRGTFVGVS